MTQPGETDNFTAYDHIKLLNSYLGKRKIDAVILNNGAIDKEIVKNYETTEQKDLVLLDYDNLKNLQVDIIENDYISIENGMIRHNTLRVAIDILSYLLD